MNAVARAAQLIEVRAAVKPCPKPDKQPRKKSNGIKETPADKWFSWCIRERANWKCERCGTEYPPPTTSLHCSHYEGRGNWATRFEPINAMCLCYGCHNRIGGRPREHTNLYRKVMGDEALDLINELAEDRQRGKEYRQTKGIGEIAAHYRKEYERMMELRAQGVVGRIEFVGYI